MPTKQSKAGNVAVMAAVVMAPIYLLASEQRSQKAGPDGVVGLDAYAQGKTVDLLATIETRTGTQLRHQRSGDGGRTWGSPVTVSRGAQGLVTPHRGMDPQIAAHGERIVVVWTVPGSDPWGGGPLGTSVSNDGGRTWSPGTNPADDGKTDGHGFIDVIADYSGVFQVVWLDDRGGRGLRGAASKDGKAWGANRTIDGQTCECCWNELAALSSDTVGVLYRDKGPTDMAIAATRNSGETWERLATVGDFKWAFDGCPHVGGGLGATVDGEGRRILHATAWTAEAAQEGLYYLQSKDMGASWSALRQIAPAEAKHSDLATDGTRVLVAWEALADGGGQIMAELSEDTGKTWGKPTRLSKGSTPNHPLTVASDGRFLVFWTERQAQGAPFEWKMSVVGASANQRSSR